MAEQDIAIRIDGVSKNFVLPHERVDSLKSMFVNPFRSREKHEMQHALKDISFEIKKGEFFGIVGRNGSGKSTLLKIIAGIYQPTKGNVQVNGRLVPFIELGVGFNPELTGRENVYLNGALMGFSEHEVDKKYHQIVEFAELERFMDQKLKNYSSGMQVRLAFSVATILADSDILLIDEVLAVGDADFQRKCFEYFKKLKKDKKTVIFVSHDMNAVREYCDRAVLINESKLISEGSADKIAKEYTRLFMPSTHEHGHDEKIGKDGKWGNGGIDMRAIKMSKTVYDPAHDDMIEFSYEVHADKDFKDELLLGFIVKDGAGRIICGTNSAIIEYERAIEIEPNKPLHLTWKLPNIFNEGAYVIEAAVDSKSQSKLLQWWDTAATFRVVNEHKTPYLVAPDIALSIKEQ